MQPTPRPSLGELRAFNLVIKILYIALFSAVGLYWVVAEMVASGLPPREPGVLRTALQAVAGVTAAAVLYLRFSRLGPLLGGSATEPNVRLSQLRVLYILCFALSEAVAIYGFVLRFLGGGREEAALFFLAAGGLFLLCYPRAPDPFLARGSGN